MSIRAGLFIATRSGGPALLSVLLVATCRSPPAQPVAALPPRVDSAKPRPSDAGPAADSGPGESTQVAQVPQDVPIERLIAEPSGYFGQRVTTSGWVVSCSVGISCTIPCRRCIMCTSRATFVPPGTQKMASCKRNGTSLIIMDLDALNNFLCSATSCEDACFRTCSFPAGTSVRLTGTIKRATPEQMGIGEEQYVFVPDPV